MYKRVIKVILCLLLVIGVAACSKIIPEEPSNSTLSSPDVTDKSGWSSWQDDEIVEDQYTEVETRTVYGYYYFSCSECGKHYPAWDFACWECGTVILEDSWHQTFDITP